MRPVMETGRTIRRRLEDPDCPSDFVILDELRAEGVTDYLIQPLEFSDGQIHAISWTTTRPGGFSDADLAALEAIRRPLARLTEIYALRRVLATLLATYVGRSTGQRILEGRIRRGDIERIHAVILLADLRGFTRLSDTLPGDRVIELLNGWFDALVPAIEAAGGEVLKFIGDGLLAIFPVGAEPATACGAALAAVGAAREALAAFNAGLRARGQAELRYGMALHRGEVLYGNIGSATRLDFTTIGPAVNLTARLETLARDLGRDLLVSAAFAAHCPDAADRARSLRAARLPRAGRGVRAGAKRPRHRRLSALAENIHAAHLGGAQAWPAATGSAGRRERRRGARRVAAERGDQRAERHHEAERRRQAEQLGEPADRRRADQKADIADRADRGDRGARRQPGRARRGREHDREDAGQAGADQARSPGPRPAGGRSAASGRGRSPRARRRPGPPGRRRGAATRRSPAKRPAAIASENAANAAAAMLVPAPRLVLR